MNKLTGVFAWKYSHYFEVLAEKEKNIIVKCKLCSDDKKPLSTARSSASNLKRHLQGKHGAEALVERTPDEEQWEAGGATDPTRQRLITGGVTSRLGEVDENSSSQPSHSVYIISEGHQGSDVDTEEICFVEMAIENGESETHATMDKYKINSAISGILEAAQGHPAEHEEVCHDGENPPAKRVRSKRSLIWMHYENLDTLRAGCCKICKEKIRLSLTGGTGNLRRHVSKRHPQVYARLLAMEREPNLDNSSQVSTSNGDTADMEVALVYSDPEDSSVRCPQSEQSLIWRHFKRLKSLNAACCLTCKKNIKCKGTGNMWRHMSKRHQQLYAKVVAKARKPKSRTSLCVSNTCVDPADVEMTLDDDSSEIQRTSELCYSDANGSLEDQAEEADNGSNPNPVRRTRPKQSLVWRHFERLDFLNAGCCHICKKKIHLNKDGGTGNLRRHMAKRHPQEFVNLVAEELKPKSLDSSHVSKNNGDTSDTTGAGHLSNEFEGERRALKREREFTEALRRTQMAEAQALEQQRVLLERLRAANTRESAAERETIESLRKALQEEAKELSREREELQREKAEMQEKWEKLQRERD